jgi:Uma2 family endonuclease
MSFKGFSLTLQSRQEFAVATTPTRLMTFEEFEQLPDPPGGRYELHHGETVFVPPPKHGHYKIQLRLRSLLENAAGRLGVVGIEMGFRPRGEREYWVADVIFVAQDRWNSVPMDGYFSGSPDLVIEVLSPSNVRRKMQDKRELCLATGSREFWIVNMDLRQVEVSAPGGPSITYKSGQQIPLFFGGSLPVDQIFG